MVMKLNFIKHTTSLQFWIPFMLAAVAVYRAAKPLANMSAHYNSPINAFAVSFLYSDKFTVFILFIGVLILFSDMPFKDNQQYFLLVRSGKLPWIFSQVLYIISVSFIYFTVIAASFCVFLFPHINIESNSWGRIVKTIAATNAVYSFDLRLIMPQNVLSDYTPLEAFIYASLSFITICVVIGLIIYAFNLIVKPGAGLIISGFFVFMYLFVSHVNAISEKMFYISPLGWCSLVIMDKNGTSSLPGLSYAITVLCCSFLVLNLLLLIYGLKKTSRIFVS